MGQSQNVSAIENEQVKTLTILNGSTIANVLRPHFTEVTNTSVIIQNSAVDNNGISDFSEMEGSGWKTTTDFIRDNIITYETDKSLYGDSANHQTNWMMENSTEKMHKPYLEEAGSFQIAYIIILLLVGLLFLVCVVLIFVYLKYRILQHKAYNISQTSDNHQYEIQDKDIIDGYKYNYNS